MPLALKVNAELDESSKRQAAQDAEKTFSDAGVRAGQAFTHEGFGSRFANDLGAIMSTHGKDVGERFMQGLSSHLSGAAGTAVKESISGITSAAGDMAAGVGAAGLVAAAGVAAVGAAAVVAGAELYRIGERFDDVAKSVEIRTGKMGSDLAELTGSIDEVARHTASSIEKIGAIGGSVSQILHLTGRPLEDLTKQIADLDRMTGESLNIRDFGRMVKANGVDAGDALDALYQAYTRTGTSVNEMVESMKNMGASARSLHLDFSQQVALIDSFDKANLNADSSVRGLNKAIAEAVKNNIDLKTVFGDAITQIQQFLAAGDEEKAQKVAERLFGTKGAQQFIDAIRQGKLTVDDINNALGKGGSTIEDMNNSTMRWADTWTIVKNRISEALKPLADPVFQGLQGLLREIFSDDTGFSEDPANAKARARTPPSSSVPQMLLPGSPAPPGQSTPPPVGGPGTFGPLGPLFPGITPPPGAPPSIFSVIPPANSGTGQPPPGPDLSDLDDGSGKGKKSEIPYPAEYGQGPMPGEDAQHWRDRMNVIETQHTLAERRADLDKLENDNTSKQSDIIKAKNDVIQAQLRETEAEQTLATQKTATAVPYGPGYGAPPRPGETEAQYGAEQRVLETQHKVAEARAQLQALEANSATSTTDLIKARNDLAAAERDEYSAQLQLAEGVNKSTAMLGELGAKIDNDFGISKGLPGIADNITKFLGNLMMAGPLAALNQIVVSSGVSGTGAGGLLGMGAVSGMFGPQFVPGFGGGGFGGGGFGVGGTGLSGGAFGGTGLSGGAFGGGGGGGMPGGDIAAAATRVLQNTGQVPLEAMPTTAAGVIASMFPQITNIGGTRMPGTAAPGTHEIGRTLDVMMPGGSTPESTTPSDLQLGNQIYAYLGEHAADLGISSMIWQDQGHNFLGGRSGAPGTGWSGQSGHMNHIDVQFMPPSYSPPAPPQAPDAGSYGGVAPSGFSPGGSAGSGANWDAIMGREAGGSGGWQANTGNGFYGGLQFTQGTWSDFGGSQFAPRADQASPDDQKTVGDRVLSTGWGGHPPQGPGAWPATSGEHRDWFGRTDAGPNGVGGTGLGGLGGPAPGPTYGGATPSPGIGGGMPGGGAGPGAMLGGAQPGGGIGGGMTAVGGGAAAGAAAGAASMGIGLAAQIAMQEAQRAIQFGGAVAGIGMEGLMQTFLPGQGSELANKNWFTRIGGALAGARPMIPNMAGKSTLTPSKPGEGGAGQPPGPPPINLTYNNNNATEDRAGKDLTHHLGVMYQGAGPGGPGAR